MLAYKCAEIWLEPDQYTALMNIAEEENRSPSEIVREMVTDFLVERAAKRQQRLAALEQLTKFREEKFKQEKHLYDGDIIQQMRDERDADIDRILKGER